MEIFLSDLKAIGSLEPDPRRGSGLTGRGCEGQRG